MKKKDMLEHGGPFEFIRYCANKRYINPPPPDSLEQSDRKVLYPHRLYRHTPTGIIVRHKIGRNIWNPRETTEPWRYKPQAHVISPRSACPILYAGASSHAELDLTDYGYVTVFDYFGTLKRNDPRIRLIIKIILVEIYLLLREKGVLLDMSLGNILINPDTLQIRFIDIAYPLEDRNQSEEDVLFRFSHAIVSLWVCNTSSFQNSGYNDSNAWKIIISETFRMIRDGGLSDKELALFEGVSNNLSLLLLSLFIEEEKRGVLLNILKNPGDKSSFYHALQSIEDDRRRLRLSMVEQYMYLLQKILRERLRTQIAVFCRKIMDDTDYQNATGNCLPGLKSRLLQSRTHEILSCV